MGKTVRPACFCTRKWCEIAEIGARHSGQGREGLAIDWSRDWFESADVVRTARKRQKEAYPKTRVTVHVVQAYELNNMQLLDKLDPFCRLALATIMHACVFTCARICVFALACLSVFLSVCLTNCLPAHLSGVCGWVGECAILRVCVVCCV